MFLKVPFVFLCLCLNLHEASSKDYEAHLSRTFLFQKTKRHTKSTKAMLKMTDYHVKCTVVSRYAVTTVQSSVWNQLPITKEAAFEVDLPSSAFISNFTITSSRKEYVAQVKERAAARRIYDAAKKQGKTAGLVATKERETEKFRVAVSVPSGAQVSFLLSYEELLPRRLGRYELSLGLRPGQLVQNLTLDVSIHERTGLSFINVLPLKTSRLLSNTAPGGASPPASTRVEQSTSCARVSYSPTLQQQSSVSSKGLNADFIIQYDVDLRDLMGDVQVYDGYFVHYFAPRGLPVVPKDVIFVIDISGSMIGTKIKQTKQAMNTILGDLREGDHFNIITFSDKVHTWKRGRTVRATRHNVQEAKEFVRRMIAEGWTNINAALLSAAQLINPSSSGSSSHVAPRRVPLIIFLTDGEATTGETSGDTILHNAKKALGSASLFGLAFGDDADFLLLKRLALENRGVARLVYEDADAALQLKGFYDEVASPLLSDVQLTYLDDQAFDVTHSLFPNYFQGSELVVAGRVKPGIGDFKVSLSAVDSKQHIKLENGVPISCSTENRAASSVDCLEGLEGMSTFVHRLWAYFTIKELLLAKLNETDPATLKLLTDKATNLSLKYNFVTPVTSLVVVKPDADEAAHTPTTTIPMTSGTSATAATMAPTKLSAESVAKKPALTSNRSANKYKPNPPRPPTNTLNRKKNSLPTSGSNIVSSRKVNATSSPAHIRTPPASFSGKKPIDSPNAVIPPSSGKIPSAWPNILRIAQPPSPGRVSSLTPNATLSTTISMLTFSTSASPARSSSTDSGVPYGETSTKHVSPVRTTPPAISGTETTTSAPDLHQPRSVPHKLSALTSLLPAAAPAVTNNTTNSDPDLSIATLLSGTFVPMPGVTAETGFWEAAGVQGELHTILFVVQWIHLTP
ncbi:inter-alpha-trypsin inhibitor heavy chain H6 [Austrofundulus limnaeus]|uniref:Inter-alpha-trypsin inhibitor heavy chain H6 n=1 Tax=Austrofundulus limnaeus TaxID=52670 RepID=A0A2I4CT05_AUSLI|nr:PREDICTED: inter-alpha-trypsin inhibitor heavy chain H6-like [Austrofundulus limnaeus]